MAQKRRQATRIGAGFNLGALQAESDPLLEDAFYESAQYAQLLDREDRHAFLIGRTGSGKSALLTRLESEKSSHTIRVSPEDLSLTYVSNSRAVRTLKAEGVHLDPLFIVLWKHVLLIEIIRHRYGVDSESKKQTVISSLFEKLKRDKVKTEALQYMEEYYGKFWREADIRVREITDTFESQIDASASINAGPAGVGASAGVTRTTVDRQEWADKMQKIVNDAQLPRLNKMIRVLDEDILDSDQNFTYLVIDDLDRDWVDEPLDNDLVRCLFRAVVDLQRVANLKVIVALRTNIFEALDFGRTGGQEEKFRALSIKMRWTQADLKAMLDERVAAAANRREFDATSISKLLPATNKRRGSALSFILERTLMRPRDAIAYLNEALAGSTGKLRITWDAINGAENEYSRNRLLALRDEWKPTFPGIDRVFNEFQGAPAEMSRDELVRRMQEVALLIVDSEYEGTIWLTKKAANAWESETTDWIDNYGELMRLLYNVGFLGCRTSSDTHMYSYIDNEYVDQRSNLESAKSFLIHPAFRSALDVAVPTPA